MDPLTAVLDLLALRFELVNATRDYAANALTREAGPDRLRSLVEVTSEARAALVTWGPPWRGSAPTATPWP